MDRIAKAGLFLSLILSALVVLCGCKGGAAELIAGDVSGPAELFERSQGEYSIDASGDTGITYLWTINPPDSGEFFPADAATTRFYAAETTQDTLAGARIFLNSDHGGPIVKEFDILIKTVGLAVGDIEGPALFARSSSATYSVQATGDTGITYEWSCDTEYWHRFETPTSNETLFTIGNIPEDTDFNVKVVLRSDNRKPVVRTKVVTVSGSSIGGIVGPELIDEYTAETYSVEVIAEDGIDYEWSCNPLNAGIFSPPDEVTTEFNAGKVYGDTTVEISVRMYSDQLDLVTERLNITIKDTYAWVRTWGGEFSDRGNAIVLDAEGNIYVTGFFMRDVDFEPGTGEDMFYSLGAGLFLTKYNQRGDYLWTRIIPAVESSGNSRITPEDIKLDGWGNIYITGLFEGRVDFSLGQGADIRESIDGGKWNSPFLLKFTTSGDFLYALTWNEGYEDEYPFAEGLGIGLDAGDVYLTGRFKGFLDMDPGGGFYWPEYWDADGKSPKGAFLLKLDASGNLSWGHSWGKNKEDSGVSVIVGQNDYVYVAGSFDGTVDFDPGPGVVEFTSVERLSMPVTFSLDQYLSCFSADGEFQWVTVKGDRLDQGVKEMVVCDNGDLVILSTEVYFGSPLFLNKYDSTGGHIWFSDVNYLYRPLGCDLAIDGSGNLYATGMVYTYYDKFRHIFLVKFDDSGVIQKMITWGNLEKWVNIGLGVAVAESGDSYVTGFFKGPADFDPVDGTNLVHSTANSDDCFVMWIPAEYY